MSDESTAEWRARYVQRRDTYGLLSSYVSQLRSLVIEASGHDWLTQAQRDELLALIEQIDSEREAVDVASIEIAQPRLTHG